MNSLTPEDPLAAAADFAHRLRFADLPRTVVERARLLVLDMVGVTVAGAAEERAISMARALRNRGSQGKSTFFVDGNPGDAADAALINAVCACSHVLDEGHKFARGHVGT
jgi:2-methylcitrate dehydratase PrpD